MLEECFVHAKVNSMRKGVCAFLYGAPNLGSCRIVLLKCSKFLAVGKGFECMRFCMRSLQPRVVFR